MIYLFKGQTLVDIAIQENGSVLAAFELALVNGLALTDTPDSYLPNRIAKKEYEVFDVGSFFTAINKRNEIVTVEKKQSLLDIAIQADGSAQCAFEWALYNGLSITDELLSGLEFKMPKSEAFRQQRIAEYFKDKKIATGFPLENSALPLQPEGIGAMITGTSFIVS